MTGSLGAFLTSGSIRTDGHGAAFGRFRFATRFLPADLVAPCVAKVPPPVPLRASPADGTQEGRAKVNSNQLVALNEELAAIVRAGVPLPEELERFGRDVGGPAAGVARELAERLQAGESLPDALDRLSVRLPPAYRALVRAGYQRGHLASALESVARCELLKREFRQRTVSMCWYPALLLTATFGVALFTLFSLLPAYAELRDTLSQMQSATMAGRAFAATVGLLERMAALLPWWGWLPVTLVGIVIVASVEPIDRRVGLSRLIPGMRRFMASLDAALLCEHLAGMLQAAAPLDVALETASYVVTDRRLRRACREAAARAGRGMGLNETFETALGWPQAVAWRAAQCRSQQQLVRVFQRMAEFYRQRARLVAKTWEKTFPLVVILGLGGACVLIAALLVFGPLAELLWAMAQPRPL